MGFKVLNWNVGGAKYLELNDHERLVFKQDLNYELLQLIRRHKPHVITLQEIVSYGPSCDEAEHIIEDIRGYNYYPFPLIDTDDLSATEKWDKVKWDKKLKNQRWPEEFYFAQGNAFLFREDLPSFPVWSLADGRNFPDKKRHYVEQVTLQFGLYFGNRDTEPRAALVAHFILRSDHDDIPLDVFVVNLHLTTLRREREGIPKKDEEASEIRLIQLEAIFHGIVSQYNTWRQEEYHKYKLKPNKKDEIITKRHPPLWILAGDFNFTPESVEYETIIRRNFIDLNPYKGAGTKAKGTGVDPTLTVDYIFAGPKFVSLDPIITEQATQNNPLPDTTVRVSDHYPLYARIPLPITSIKPLRPLARQ